MKILGFNIFFEELNKINYGKKTIINTINPHSYYTSKKDSEFKLALKKSNYLVPDGIGFVIASIFLYKKRIKRITGYDLHEFFINKADKESLKVFYFGSNKRTLKMIMDKNKKRFNNLSCRYFSPPYKDKFTNQENKSFVNLINEFNPDILFIGMTAPKQEKWVYNNFHDIDCKVFLSIGAVFDFYSGTIRRPKIFFQKIGLEWFIRFLNEPKRLFKRNFISLPFFLKDLVTAFFKLK